MKRFREDVEPMEVTDAFTISSNERQKLMEESFKKRRMLAQDQKEPKQNETNFNEFNASYELLFEKELHKMLQVLGVDVNTRQEMGNLLKCSLSSQKKTVLCQIFKFSPIRINSYIYGALLRFG